MRGLTSDEAFLIGAPLGYLPKYLTPLVRQLVKRGLVVLVRDDNEIVTFRETDLGREALRIHRAISAIEGIL